MNNKWQEWVDLDYEYNEDIHSRRNRRKTKPTKKKKSYKELQERKQKNEQVYKNHPTRS